MDFKLLLMKQKKNASQEGQEKIVSEKIITEDQAVAEVFNNFFINIVPNLTISTDLGYDNDFIAKLQTRSISLGIIQVSL